MAWNKKNAITMGPLGGADDTSRIYQAYSGCDMTAHINGVRVGTMQAVTLSITREIVPIYTMGSADVKTFVKGKRGIAGTLVFSVFDRAPLIYDVFRKKFTTGDGGYGKTGIFDLLDSGQWATGDRYGDPVNVDAGQIQNLNYSGNSDIAAMVKEKPLRYSDEIPPFNITLTMVNETGSASFFTIEGITLVSEGYGYTMDDLTSETAFTYVARKVTPLKNLTDFFYPA